MLVRREQVCDRVCVSVSGEDDPLFHCGFFFFFFEVCDLCSGAGACLPVHSLERRRRRGGV